MSIQKKRSYHSTVRSKQAIQTRGRILASAKKLFALKSFEEVTIDELAKVAEVSSPTIYSLFKSKRGVLLALIGEALPPQAFESLVEEAKQQKTAEARLRISAKIARQMYDAEQKQVEFLRGASVLGSEFLKIEKEQEERRYRRQKNTMNKMAKESLLAHGVSVAQARDVLWALTGRDMYRLFVVVRGWSPDKYEAWLAEALIKLIAK